MFAFAFSKGDIAKLVEHSLNVRRVPGSNPGGSNKINLYLPSPMGGSVAIQMWSARPGWKQVSDLIPLSRVNKILLSFTYDF